MKYCKNESGRSMIEMLGVLAIIGVLSVGGIAGYSKAMMKYRINKTIEQITLIVGNMRSFTASQPADRRYAGIWMGCGGLAYTSGMDSVSDVVRKAHLVPDETLVSPKQTFISVSADGSKGLQTQTESTNVINAFGGGICFNSMDQEGKTLSLGVFDIPMEACIDIASQDWSALNPESMEINGSAYSGGVEDAITLCSLDHNGIVFVIK
ncbi:MAG: hypothetical protein IKO06_04765 [Alphaproteobacteria bacterium]|nr:hypothetical protein [Alphaproteobacteria bacterium]